MIPRLDLIAIAIVSFLLFVSGVYVGAMIVDKQNELRNEFNRQIHCNKKELT